MEWKREEEHEGTKGRVSLKVNMDMLAAALQIRVWSMAMPVSVVWQKRCSLVLSPSHLPAGQDKFLQNEDCEKAGSHDELWQREAGLCQTDIKIKIRFNCTIYSVLVAQINLNLDVPLSSGLVAQCWCLTNSLGWCRADMLPGKLHQQNSWSDSGQCGGFLQRQTTCFKVNMSISHSSFTHCTGFPSLLQSNTFLRSELKFFKLFVQSSHHCVHIKKISFSPIGHFTLLIMSKDFFLICYHVELICTLMHDTGDTGDTGMILVRCSGGTVQKLFCSHRQKEPCQWPTAREYFSKLRTSEYYTIFCWLLT